jgi:hypothetical protein
MECYDVVLFWFDVGNMSASQTWVGIIAFVAVRRVDGEISRIRSNRRGWVGRRGRNVAIVMMVMVMVLMMVEHGSRGRCEFINDVCY